MRPRGTRSRRLKRANLEILPSNYTRQSQAVSRDPSTKFSWMETSIFRPPTVFPLSGSGAPHRGGTGSVLWSCVRKNVSLSRELLAVGRALTLTSPNAGEGALGGVGFRAAVMSREESGDETGRAGGWSVSRPRRGLGRSDRGWERGSFQSQVGPRFPVAARWAPRGVPSAARGVRFEG